MLDEIKTISVAKQIVNLCEREGLGIKETGEVCLFVIQCGLVMLENSIEN